MNDDPEQDRLAEFGLEVGQQVRHDGVKARVSTLQAVDDLERGIVRLQSDGVRFARVANIRRRGELLTTEAPAP